MTKTDATDPRLPLTTPIPAPLGQVMMTQDYLRTTKRQTAERAMIEWTFYVMNADPPTPVLRFLELMHVKGNS
jgi:hypothetical protein